MKGCKSCKKQKHVYNTSPRSQNNSQKKSKLSFKLIRRFWQIDPSTRIHGDLTYNRAYERRKTEREIREAKNE